MPFTSVDLLLGFVLPLALAWAICQAGFWVRGASDSFVSRLSFPLAFIVSVSAGYYSLGLGPMIPRFDRDWLVLSAWLALPASACLSARKPMYSGALIAAAVGIVVAAILLVPTWESLLPVLTQYRAALITGTLFLCAISVLATNKADRVGTSDSLEPGDQHDASATIDFSDWRQAALWGSVLLMFFFCAALMALSGSLGFATVAIAMLGAGLGIWVVCVTNRSGDVVMRSASIVPVWAVLVSGLVFTAYVNSSASIPVLSYALLPFSPAVGAQLLPRRGSVTRRRHLVGVIFVTGLVCAVALGFAVAAQWDSLTAQDAY